MAHASGWHGAARLGMVAASLVMLPGLMGCGSGYFTEQKGGGGGGGGSGTLIQMVMSPVSDVVGLRGTVQFSVSGTLSDGSSTTPSVTYQVTNGLISPGGLYTAPAVAGSDTVIATSLGGLQGTPPCCVDTSVVTVTTNPPTGLEMVAQAGGATSGVAFTNQPVVEVVDALDRQLLQSGVAVTAAIASGSGTLGGTTTVLTDTNGRAVFTNLEIVGTGTFTLQFTSPGLTSVTGGSFSVAE